MRLRGAVLGVWLMLGVAGWSQDQKFLTNVDLQYIESGDRINLFDAEKQNVIECHLAGVEAPPPVKRGSKVQDFATEAREWLTNRLRPLFGQDSQLKIQDLGDVNGRREVVLLMGNSSVSINEQLISLGLGVHADTGFAGMKEFDDRLDAAERHALMFRKGIWDVAKQETQEVVVNIAQGKKIRKDESFYTYVGVHDRNVYEIRLVFRDIRNDKLIFSEVAIGRNADSKQFQNDVEIPIFDRMGIWEYREFGRDNDRPKKFRFGVIGSRVWLCSVGEAKRQTRIIKPGDPSISDKTKKSNPGGQKNSMGS
jgi:endonuclease YncB( thermonuclease family)